nr:MAG TPA: hypothetical protein [Caudoviricetes sp.]
MANNGLTFAPKSARFSCERGRPSYTRDIMPNKSRKIGTPIDTRKVRCYTGAKLN